MRSGLVLLLGLVVARVSSRLLHRLAHRSWNGEQAELARRLTWYIGAALALTWSMHELGLDIAVVLGAAGIASVALGFAAQTLLSNVIGGFLLFGERLCRVGDVIAVSGETGEVLAVNLVSTALRTFNNRFVRIPNETMIKTTVVNLTRFPIRRLDLEVPIAYSEDLERVREVLEEAAEQNAYCLDQPAPLFFVAEYTESHVRAQFSPWCETSKWIPFLQTMTREVKAALDRHEVQFPYPRRVILAPEISETPVATRNSSAP